MVPPGRHINRGRSSAGRRPTAGPSDGRCGRGRGAPGNQRRSWCPSLAAEAARAGSAGSTGRAAGGDHHLVADRKLVEIRILPPEGAPVAARISSRSLAAKLVLVLFPKRLADCYFSPSSLTTRRRARRCIVIASMALNLSGMIMPLYQ
jgi:hypothetical protein